MKYISLAATNSLMPVQRFTLPAGTYITHRVISTFPCFFLFYSRLQICQSLCPWHHTRPLPSPLCPQAPLPSPSPPSLPPPTPWGWVCLRVLDQAPPQRYPLWCQCPPKLLYRRSWGKRCAAPSTSSSRRSRTAWVPTNLTS